VADCFEIVAKSKEKDFEMMLTWDATLIELDIEMVFPLAIFNIKVVSVYHLVARQAEFSREALGVILNEPKLIPSTVRLIAPELGEFLRTTLLPSTR